MKNYDKIIVWNILLFSAIIVLTNCFFPKYQGNSTGIFKVETNRIAQEISAGNEVNINNYQAVAGIYECTDDNVYHSENPYVIYKINGRFYRMEYREPTQGNRILQFVNIALILLFCSAFSVLLYVRQKIIKPFNEISELPHRLAKGNLTAPLKETKSRYFGKFIWGLDMLREELENSRRRELEHAKREKTAMLSISHDIKTPLAAIKLYAQAISNNLYSDGEKQRLSAESINAKADEIERYVNELTSKINGDFMEFHAVQKEVYLSVILNKITAYYSEKLELLETEFMIADYADCLILCDPERLVEVLQNVMENAIKYSDGKMIRIDVSDEENCRLITISNSGNSLPDAEISHVFDSFWRGSNTKNINGNGLGLYICRRLMNEMNGDIYTEIHKDMFCVTIVCHKLT